MHIHSIKEFQLYRTLPNGKQVRVNRKVIIETIESMFNDSNCDKIEIVRSMDNPKCIQLIEWKV